MRRGALFRRLRTDDRQHAVAKVRRDAVGVDGQRQLERAAEAAVAPLDAVVLLARNVALAALPGNLDACRR